MAIEPSDSDYATALLNVPEKLRDKVLKGDIVMYNGRDDRPVLRWAKGNSEGRPAGAMVPGSGLHPNTNHGNVGEISSRFGYKRTNAYKDLLTHLVPAIDDPEVRGSVAWLFERAFDMVEGGDVLVNVTCPECAHHFQTSAYKRGDSKALTTVLEQVLEKPAQRQEISFQGEMLHDYLNKPTDLETIEVFTVSPEESQKRRRLLEGPDE